MRHVLAAELDILFQSAAKRKAGAGTIRLLQGGEGAASRSGLISQGQFAKKGSSRNLSVEQFVSCLRKLAVKLYPQLKPTSRAMDRMYDDLLLPLALREAQKMQAVRERIHRSDSAAGTHGAAARGAMADLADDRVGVVRTSSALLLGHGGSAGDRPRGIPSRSPDEDVSAPELRAPEGISALVKQNRAPVRTVFMHYTGGDEWMTTAQALQFAKHFGIVPELVNLATFQETMESMHRMVAAEAAEHEAGSGPGSARRASSGGKTDSKHKSEKLVAGILKSAKYVDMLSGRDFVTLLLRFGRSCGASLPVPMQAAGSAS